MLDRCLSLRSLTVALVCTAALSAGTLALPSLLPSASMWISAVAEDLVQGNKTADSPNEFSAAAAPTAVLLSWNTYGNLGTETTEPSVSNDPNLAPSTMTLGSGVTPAGNADRFGGTAWFDTGNSNPTTLAESVAENDYIQFVVTPNAGFTFTPVSLVFGWARSSSGPANVTLRSSVDGFSTDLGSVLGMPGFQSNGNTITISGLTGLTSATTFRLYGYGATASGGAGGFDVSENAVNVVLNGTVSAAPAGEISLDPGSMSFGNQPIGSTSGSRSVTISNTGSGALNIGQLVKSGANASEFAIIADPSNTSIAAGGTAKLRMTFSPTGDPGSRTASISIPSNDSDEPSVVVNLSGTATILASPAPVKSMWVWGGTPNPVTDAAGRTLLIQRASANAITDLYVSVRDGGNLNAQGWSMYPTADVAALISAAHAAGMKVWYTTGDPAWQAQPCNATASSYNRMQEVVAYNNFVAADAKFDGVMVDVEPGAAFDVSLYVGIHQCYRGILSPEVKLGTAINAFWEDSVEYPTGGETKLAFEHIIDNAPIDQLVVMGYRDTVGVTGGNGIIGLDEDEIGYATSIGKAGLVLAGVETKDVAPSQPESITFFEEGQAVMDAAITSVDSHFETSAGFGGFSIHAYGDEYVSGVSGWPEGFAAPQVTTADESLVTGTSATLNGLANPNGAPTTGYFYYGTTDTGNCLTLGTRGPAVGGADLGSGTAETSFFQAITGLTPATVYYFCAVAENVGGVSTGTIFSFTTSGPPSDVATESATAVSAVTATLNGYANPNGVSAVGYFRYGSSDPGSCDDSFGTRAPSSGGVDLGSGTSQLPFSQAISGLAPATTYWYCAIAESSGGRSFGSVFTFTTGGVPTAVTENATAVTATSAMLNGFGTANGAPSIGYFRYGTTNPTICDDSYGTRTPASGGVDLGAGTSQVPFSQSLSGLLSSTIYYFCAAAMNDGGTNFGSTFSFTTPARTLVVDNTSDLNTMDECTVAANDCSLRGAVAVAQDGDTITFDTTAMGIESISAATITLGGSEILIDDDITIDGPGADKLTVSGDLSSRVFNVSGATVEINGMTISHGRAISGGGVLVGGGFVVFDGLYFFQNSAQFGVGGAVMIQGDGQQHTIRNSTFAQNASRTGGGAISIEVGNSVDIDNCTFSANVTSMSAGGAIRNFGTVNLRNSTLTKNEANTGGGGIVNAGVISLRNNLIAMNVGTSQPEILNDGTFTSSGFNLVGAFPGHANDTWLPVTYHTTDILDTDPLLGTLQNNGGSTYTHALLLGSPAIDQGSAFGLTTDQRGVPRPVDLGGVTNAAGGDGSDIGAYEMLAPSAARASISGRVTNAYGRAISGAVITASAMDGTLRRAYTNSLGYYRMEGLQAGESFVVAVSARRYEFAEPVRLVDLADNIRGLSFTASR